MAKDYVLTLAEREKIGRAIDVAGSIVKGLSEAQGEIWKLRQIMRHAKHGRCGGNADQALAELEAWLRDRHFGFDRTMLTGG